MEILAHQVGIDPLQIHEFFVLAAAAGGGLLLGIGAYVAKARRRVKIWFLLTRRRFLRAVKRHL